MSIPISSCQVVQAANGNDELALVLFEAMDYNLQVGIYSVGGCQCDPTCHASEEKMADLTRRFHVYRVEEREKRASQQVGLPPVSFDSWMFPIIQNQADAPITLEILSVQPFYPKPNEIS